jgi:hypothetical protein
VFMYVVCMYVVPQHCSKLLDAVGLWYLVMLRQRDAEERLRGRRNSTCMLSAPLAACIWVLSCRYEGLNLALDP